MAGQACACASVGTPNSLRNQASTAGWKELFGRIAFSNADACRKRQSARDGVLSTNHPQGDSMPGALAKCTAVLIGIFLAASAAAAAPAESIEVLWLGHSTFRITTVTGKVIVIDP